MPKIHVHRLTDLPSVTTVSVGDQVGNSQRFNLVQSPITRRLYTIKIEGPHEPGVYVVQIRPLTGDELTSIPVQIPYGAEMALVTAEIVGPIFGEFVVSVAKIADVPKPQQTLDAAAAAAAPEPDEPSESPAEPTK